MVDNNELNYEMPVGCGKNLEVIPCYSLAMPWAPPNAHCRIWAAHKKAPSGILTYWELGQQACWTRCGSAEWDKNYWRAYCADCMRRAGWIW